MKGAWGEQAARVYLERKGYRTVETNFRTRFGEIDIIAAQGKYIVFVEVKTRKSDRFAAAREFVTPAKQQRIIAAASLWLRQHPTEKQPRFDVIEVYGKEGTAAVPRINHLENAFGG
ncbi:MAG TPA: YraN family protein [Candidatus Agathobaculum merdavium]|nr:YraN family protein [Candidatus Agathobaculum merdavium]